MNKPLILVVEDDTPVRNLITMTLKTHEYRYLSAQNGASAVMEALSHNPDIVLLDLGLPDMDGVEVIRKIRSWSNMPIIVISARTEDSDKIGALDAGADDYLTKPFSVDELLARLRVTQRRLALIKADTAQESPIFTNGALKIDYAAGCAYLDGAELHLTPIEYKLLCLLSKNVGKVLTHTYITQQIWGSSWENDIASLRVFMATLRKKLENGKDGQQYIQTHIGIGYRMLRGEWTRSLCPPLADCLCHQHGIYFCKWHILFQFPFSAVLLPVMYKGKGHALPIKFAVLSKRHSLHTYNDDRVIGCVGKFTYFFLCISPYHCIF